MDEGLKTGARVKTETDKLEMEYLNAADRPEVGGFWTNIMILMMQSKEEELMTNSRIMLGAGQKIVDVGGEVVDIAKDL